MKALSIHQPWAWAILHAGKDVENRGWRTNHRGPLIIHASKTRVRFDAQDADEWRERFGVTLPPWSELMTRAILGIVDVVDCVPVAESTSRWAFGPWCWVLANPRPLPAPIPRAGQQGLFTIGDDVLPVEFRCRT